jgi:hypothetical protein
MRWPFQQLQTDEDLALCFVRTRLQRRARLYVPNLQLENTQIEGRQDCPVNRGYDSTDCVLNISTTIHLGACWACGLWWPSFFPLPVRAREVLLSCWDARSISADHDPRVRQTVISISTGQNKNEQVVVPHTTSRAVHQRHDGGQQQ